MADRRVYLDKEQVGFVKKLSDTDSDHKVFNNMAQCLSFSAAYGFKNNKREKIERAPTSMVDPISYHIFENGNFDTLFNLIATESEQDSKVLGSDEDMTSKRIEIFEEYAKGGLKLLEAKTRGQVDSLDAILMIILGQLNNDIESDPGFNITNLSM